MIDNLNMSSAFALIPLFRSEQQLRILGVLFGGIDRELAIGELADLAGVSQATASREVARLAEHGIVTVRRIGRNAMVSANWDLPWAHELRSILIQTVGVVGRLGEALSVVEGIEEAYVFGSWAERIMGQPGPPPRDVDVLIVGTAPLHAVRRACSTVEQDLAIEVNPVVLSRGRWHGEGDDPLVTQVRQEPLVSVPLAPR